MSGPRSRLRPLDLLGLGTAGLRARPTRAILSALGIALGIAAMIAVVGISASSRAQLDRQLDRLGTNLLTATAGTDFTGRQVPLPVDALGRVRLIEGVQKASSTATLAVPVYRSSLSDPAATGGISSMVADRDLLGVVAGVISRGQWLNDATSSYPAVVLGHDAAERLGVVTPGTQIWLGDAYFTVVGILDPVALVPDLDAAALVGTGVARQLLGYNGHPSTVYQRVADDRVVGIRDLLAPTIRPENPGEVQVSRPSDALAARDAADQAFTNLLLGLGSIALLVGGIGVANTMIISVLERRREIGLRRSLGATRGHIRTQFLAEALLLSALGGTFGVALGAGATLTVGVLHGWPYAMPGAALLGGVTSTLVIGAVAGLYPAIRAARIPPTAALRT